MADTSPASPVITAPIPGEDIAMSVARAASAAAGGYPPYEEPEADGDGRFYIEMPPHVTTAAAPGFRWISLRQMDHEIRHRGHLGNDPGYLLDVARHVWERVVENTWRENAVYIAWTSPLTGMLIALVFFGLMRNLLVPAIPILLGGAGVSALRDRPKSRWLLGLSWTGIATGILIYMYWVGLVSSAIAASRGP